MTIDSQVVIHGLLFLLAFGAIYLAFFGDTL